MFIIKNLTLILNQFIGIIYSPFNRLLILACSTQIASMIVKLIINTFKSKKISYQKMVTYGGMPSSHTAFVMSLVFGIAFDPDFGWKHPLFAIVLVFSMIVIVDTVRLRGVIDKLNDAVKIIINNDDKLKDKINLPKLIAHTTAEVIGGIIFSFIYTIVFYLLLYSIFPV